MSNKGTPSDNRFSEGRERQLFDHYAASYAKELNRAIGFSGQEGEFFVQAKVDLLCDLVAETLGNTVGVKLLDVGCGIGAMHRKLAEAGINITGADVASSPIEIARAANPFARYHTFDDNKLPFENGSFDMAIAVCVFHHVAATDQSRLLAEMRRVTRQGGLVALIEHNPLNPLTRYAVWRCPFDEYAVLLSARRSRDLLESTVGKAATRYFLFLPSRHRWIAAAERHLAWLALGAQYCSYATNRNSRAL